MVQRMRTFSRAQDVVSTIICWCSHSSSVGGDLGAKQGEFFAEQAREPALEPYRHTGILPRAAVVLPSPSEFSPSYNNLVPEYWRDVILAGRSRKSSAPLVRRPLSQSACLKRANNGLVHRSKWHNYPTTLEAKPRWRVDPPYGSMSTPGLSMPCGSSSLFAARSAAAKSPGR
jgi:hypothetical protein